VNIHLILKSSPASEFDRHTGKLFACPHSSPVYPTPSPRRVRIATMRSTSSDPSWFPPRERRRTVPRHPNPGSLPHLRAGAEVSPVRLWRIRWTCPRRCTCFVATMKLSVTGESMPMSAPLPEATLSRVRLSPPQEGTGVPFPQIVRAPM